MLNLENFPTIQQAHAHESVSDRYGFVSTAQVLEVLADHDWHPATIKEMNVRKHSRKGFQQHLIRLRQKANTAMIVGQVIPEIVFLNAHDRSSQVELFSGLFRLACLNGLTVGIGGKFQTYKIRHIGYTAEKVALALQSIVTETPLIAESVERFQAIQLTDSEQVAYAESAIELVNDGEKFAMRPYDVLSARRYDDRKSDLWTTFNRVQENVIKGGINRTTTDGRSRRTREVKSIDRNVDLNRALWSLTEKMAELKAN
jgi:hypothetical protein